MKKNKLNRGKRVGYVLMGLSAVALIGVGFSTWIIQVQDSKETGDVTVDVADVQDQSLKIELGGNNGVTDGNIHFDAPKDDATGAIIFGGSGEGEDLQFAIQFSIDMKNPSIFNGITLRPSGTGLAAIQGWVDSKWVVAPFAFADQESNLVDATWTEAGDHYLAQGKNTESGAAWDTHVNVAVEGTKRTYAVTYKFAWGSAFNGKNPALHDDTPENTQASLTALEAFKAQGNATNFKLTLKHDPQASGRVTIS